MEYAAKVLWREYPSMKEVEPSFERILHISDTLFVQNYNRAVELLGPNYEKWNAEYDESKHGSYNGYIMNLMNGVIANDRWLKLWEPKVQALDIGEGEPEIIGFVETSFKRRFVCFIRIQKV